MSKKTRENKSRKHDSSNNATTQEHGASEDRLEFTGVVVKQLPNNQYRVQVNDHEVLAYVSGKMKMNSIKIVEGDKVRVEVSPYDLSRGRIVFRSK